MSKKSTILEDIEAAFEHARTIRNRPIDYPPISYERYKRYIKLIDGGMSMDEAYWKSAIKEDKDE